MVNIKKSLLPWATCLSAAVFFSLSTTSYALQNTSTIDWQPCEETPGDVFECATVTVPLNYQQSDDERTIDIAMARLPALDQQNKKGSLFLNPGGPGGSGVGFVFWAGKSLYNEEVRQKFDLVGFDPRGIGRTETLTCFETEDELTPLFNTPPFPVTPDQISNFRDIDQYVADLCLLRGGDIVDHMSTADVARDLDLLRQAVGDDKLHFAGYSYGSYLGVVYANLFPEKVGAMIVDGVLDPIAWSRGRGLESYFFPFSTRVRSDEGAIASLDEFFRTCEEGGINLCAFAGNSAERYAAIADSLLVEPIVFTLPDGEVVELDYATFITFTLSSMYDPGAWSNLATLLVLIEAADIDQIMPSYVALRNSLGYEDDEPPVEQPGVGFAGVVCADSDNPLFYENWEWAAQFADKRSAYFGRQWTWISSICNLWSGSKESRYEGRFRTHTENPVLVINTLFDAATPYHGAKVVNRLLRKSRLLTVNGWGHTSLFISECAAKVAADYLLEGKLPERGASCDVDSAPFNASLPNSNALVQKSSLSALTRQNTAENEAKRRTLLKHIRPSILIQ